MDGWGVACGISALWHPERVVDVFLCGIAILFAFSALFVRMWVRIEFGLCASWWHGI
jgi:hypothetical protein